MFDDLDKVSFMLVNDKSLRLSRTLYILSIIDMRLVLLIVFDCHSRAHNSQPYKSPNRVIAFWFQRTASAQVTEWNTDII